MNNRTLIIYFTLLALFSAAFIIGAKLLGQQGTYLAQGYMLTPALAAIITRAFFHPRRFKDASLRPGRAVDWLRYWLYSLAITLLSYLLFTALGSISWDLSGRIFLDRLTRQFSSAGQDISASLPPGFTPRMMLLLFFFGGLTVFNIFPGILSGFGEEFGHRGLMFPLLYRIRPWVGIIIGGLVWYAWHLPLGLIIPQSEPHPVWQILLNALILAAGSICTFTYLAYVYVSSRSIWVASLAHITMNNAAAALSYFVVIRRQVLANLGLSLTMAIVVAILYHKHRLTVFREYFSADQT